MTSPRVLCVMLAEYDRFSLDLTEAGFVPIKSKALFDAEFEAAKLPEVLIFSGEDLTEENIRALRKLPGGVKVYVICLATSDVEYADVTFPPAVDGKTLVAIINQYLEFLRTH